jgi:trans-2-enoyl-CoA reductase
MDHQVEYDADVNAARIEHRQAVRLDEVGLHLQVAKCQQGRVEAFDVTHLNDFTIFLAQFDQLFGFRQGFG